MDWIDGEFIGAIFFFLVWAVAVSVPLTLIIFSLQWLKGRLK